MYTMSVVCMVSGMWVGVNGMWCGGKWYVGIMCYVGEVAWEVNPVCWVSLRSVV